LLDGLDVAIDVVATSLEELCEAEPADGDRVLVAGGDGTVHRVAQVAVEKGWIIGILPAGTANDLARGLGIPLEPADACRVIAQGPAEAIDVGWVNDQVLLNAAQVGLGPEVSSAADRGHKSRWGRFSYFRGLVEAITGRQGFQARIEADDEQAGGYWLNVTVANGPCFGGGHSPEPEPRIDDGLLDVVAWRSRPLHRLGWAWLMRRVGIGYPDAVRHWRAARVRITTSHPKTVTLDGDPTTESPVEATVRTKALRVIVPPASAAGADEERLAK
jgi:YegS/Rv2252/BmrU family lipid kinase